MEEMESMEFFWMDRQADDRLMDFYHEEMKFGKVLPTASPED